MPELIERRAPPSDTPAMILAGGIALIGGALAFMAVFSYLAGHFRYPEVLDGPAEQVLPALFATGDRGRAVWAVYSVLPLVFLPGSIAAFCALRDRAAGITRAGGFFALVAAVSMMLGLMRWPSVHWELARAWAMAGESDRLALAAVFYGLNSYLGNFVGEFLGELCLSVFFVLTGIGLLRHRQAPKVMGWWGVLTGVLGLIGMWRNVPGAMVGAVAELNNYLLPFWMIGFGAWLVFTARRLHKHRS
jgi:hypothetical protein